MTTSSHVPVPCTRKPAILSQIEAWPYWSDIVAVAVKEYGLSEEEAQAILPEYQRFLALLAAEQRLGMHSVAVDKLWHAHVLHTRLYSLFCQEYLGRFIDHVPVCTTAYECETGPDTNPLPVPPPQPPKPPEKAIYLSAPTQARFWLAYHRFFGEAPSPAIWNLPDAESAAVPA
ncbi:glycine-rich domain-containing protein [Ktedonobacter racemifer]|uniref:Uncharacterized protein n=1 Tax=Ktedonobacter racemifer DSM 44963 TaxID=485913 RepID=D6U693_KTERA|nr:hypothetical protein [Ktedonobacter racemifer]EFH80504.1 conserved hypothetical protein [Ktedonobacter racemifer DSM 44963]